MRRIALALLAISIVIVAGGRGDAELVPCSPDDAPSIESALNRIEHSVDPCGESDQVVAVVETVRRCAVNRVYQVCTSRDTARNLFDRPLDVGGAAMPRTITWNPTLESELEDACDGDPATPLRRDPIASLLHELVHAAHDCLGLDPGTREIEAVRIENIYRRAAGLCQRTRYGDSRLPAAAAGSCTRGACTCPATTAAAVWPPTSTAALRSDVSDTSSRD